MDLRKTATTMRTRLDRLFLSLPLPLLLMIAIASSMQSQTINIRSLPTNPSPSLVDYLPEDSASGSTTYKVTPNALLALRTITCTAPLLCAGGASTTLANDITFSITPGVFALIAHGSSSHTGNIFPAADTGHSLNGGWIDISANTLGNHPIAGWRRLAVNPATGELSIENSSSTYISLENHVPLPISEGGSGTVSTLTGLVRGNASAMTASELSGDATTSGSNVVTVTKINGVSFAGLGTGLLKNTTGTGALSIATLGDITALLGTNSITDAMVVNDITVNSTHTITTSASLGVGSGGTSPDSTIEASINTATLPTPSTGTMLHIGQADTVAARVQTDVWGSFVSYDGRRADGTNASPSAIVASDVIIQYAGIGRGATAYSAGSRAMIQFLAAENWSDSAQGTEILFKVTPTGSTTTATALGIDASGHLISSAQSSPTVACTGAGTSPPSPTIAGTDLAFVVTINTGTLPSSSGTCTITYAKTYSSLLSSSPGVLACMLVSGASSWGNSSTIILTTESLTAPVLTWTNDAAGTLTSLTGSSSVKFQCVVVGRT